MSPNNIRVAIADDHQMIVDGLKAIIEGMEGAEVWNTFGNGLLLLGAMKSGTPDVILMDVNMPEMDGIATTKEVVDKYPDVKVIMLTMHGSADYIQKLLKAGAHGYLLKNTGKQELKAAIETVVKGEPYYTEEVKATVMQHLGPKKQRSSDHIEVSLTAREQDVLKLIAQEMTTKEIADALCISHHTVESHRKNLISKLGVRGTAGLVKHAISLGLND